MYRCLCIATKLTTVVQGTINSKHEKCFFVLEHVKKIYPDNICIINRKRMHVSILILSKKYYCIRIGSKIIIDIKETKIS